MYEENTEVVPSLKAGKKKKKKKDQSVEDGVSLFTVLIEGSLICTTVWTEYYGVKHVLFSLSEAPKQGSFRGPEFLFLGVCNNKLGNFWWMLV